MDESDYSEENEASEEKKEEVLDPENPAHYFLIVERDFNKTLLEIEKIPEALQMIAPFNKLFENFFKTFSKLQDLEHLSTNMRNEIAEKDHKIDLTLKLAEEDEKTINDLKKQIENAWRLADGAHAREQLAHEIIDNLRRQVENLNAELDFKNKMSMEDDAGEMKNRDSLERERDRLMNEVTQLTTKLTNAMGYQEELERKNSEVDLKMNEVTGQLEDQTQETLRQKRAKEKLEAEILDLKFKLDEKDTQALELIRTITEKNKQVHIIEKEYRDLKHTQEKLQKELDYSLLKLSRLSDEHNNAQLEIDHFKKQIQEKNFSTKGVIDEVNRLKMELTKASKAGHMMERKVSMIQHDRENLIVERNNLRQRIYMFEREIDEFKKSLDDDKRHLEVMAKEKDVLNKSLQRQQAIQKDQLKLIQIQEQAKKKLEIELDLFFVESGKNKKNISRLERDRERLSEEQLDLTNTIQDQIEDIRVKKALIFDLKKDTVEKDFKIRQQQNMYEAMRSDRNALQKANQEATAELAELKKKLKLLNHQIEQFKENIGQREKQIVKDETVMRKFTKEREQLRVEIMQGLDNLRRIKEDYNNTKDELKRTQQFILFQTRTLRSQGTSLEQLVNERDILGSQLVRRNDEVALLNEKITLLQATLSRGETHYDLRLGDIRLLKLEIKRLRQEKSHISKTMASMVDLRQEIFHLERDLTKSRLKCKALEQEVQNPLNIHRWRKLAGSDPDVLDLLQKIQILQRRLLHQGSIGVERERKLKQAEKLYLNLKKVVSKQPGPAVQDELGKTQRALKDRGNKLKCLVSELNMADLKVSEFKSELDKVSAELADLKKKYLAEKKAHRTLRMALESSRELNQTRDNESGEVKFTGGGFRMSVSQISSK